MQSSHAVQRSEWLNQIIFCSQFEQDCLLVFLNHSIDILKFHATGSKYENPLSPIVFSFEISTMSCPAEAAWAVQLKPTWDVHMNSMKPTWDVHMNSMKPTWDVHMNSMKPTWDVHMNSMKPTWDVHMNSMKPTWDVHMNSMKPTWDVHMNSMKPTWDVHMNSMKPTWDVHMNSMKPTWDVHMNSMLFHSSFSSIYFSLFLGPLDNGHFWNKSQSHYCWMSVLNYMLN